MKDTPVYRYWLTAALLTASMVLTACGCVDAYRSDGNGTATTDQASMADVMEADGQTRTARQSLEFSTLDGGLGFVEPINKIIRSEDQWAALYKIYKLGDLAYIGDSPPPFPYDVDFSKYMVVVVSMGKQEKTGQYSASVTIESISVVDNVVQVRYLQRVPPKDAATFGEHVYPAHIVKTAKTDLAKEFIPRTEVINVH